MSVIQRGVWRVVRGVRTAECVRADQTNSHQQSSFHAGERRQLPEGDATPNPIRRRPVASNFLLLLLPLFSLYGTKAGEAAGTY